MNALKGIVFLMTLAIAVLMTLIVYGMYQKSQDPDFKFLDLGGDDISQADGPQTGPQAGTALPSAPSSAPTALPPAPLKSTQPPLAAFGDVTLDLPEGASIASASVSGTHMSLIVTQADGGTEVWVVELSSGAVLGRIKAQP